MNIGLSPGAVSGFRYEFPVKYCANASLGTPVPNIFAFSNSFLSVYFIVVPPFNLSFDSYSFIID
jgi:hypothetical protein